MLKYKCLLWGVLSCACRFIATWLPWHKHQRCFHSLHLAWFLLLFVHLPPLPDPHQMFPCWWALLFFPPPSNPRGLYISKSTRKDLDGILGRISSWRRWSGVEMGCPGKWWWSPHPKIPPLSSMTVLYQDSSDLSWLWSVTWSPSLWEFLGKLMQIHGRHACKAMNDLNYIKSQPDGLIYSQTPLHLD